MIELNNKMSTKEINKKLSGSGYFTFAKGVYKLTEPLVLTSSTTVKCEDGAVFERHHSGRMVMTKASKKTTKYNGCYDVAWLGGTFIADTHKGNANVWTLFHAQEVSLSNMKITGCVGLHSIEINACKDVVMNNVHISDQSSRDGENYREAIQIDFASYDGLKWDGALNTSKCYDLTHCQNIGIHDCRIINCPAGIGTHTVSEVEKYHKNIEILNNSFQQVPVQVRLEGMDSVKVNDAHVLVKTMKKGHKAAGGKVSIDPRGCKNLKLYYCEEVKFE